jgi:hypothetical protein
VTYNGVAMTQIITSTATDGAGNASSMWGILDADLPASGGTYSVVVSGLDSGAYARAIEMNNVDQVIPTGSAIDENATGNVTTSTTTVTAPSGYSLALGCCGMGNDVASFNSPPTGTGTWTRLFDDFNPPSSAHWDGAYQAFTSSGSKDYTETASAGWYRASHLVAVFAAYVPPAAAALNAPFFGCIF